MPSALNATGCEAEPGLCWVGIVSESSCWFLPWRQGYLVVFFVFFPVLLQRI